MVEQKNKWFEWRQKDEWGIAGYMEAILCPFGFKVTVLPIISFIIGPFVMSFFFVVTCEIEK